MANQTFDHAVALLEAHDCARNIHDWNKVSSSLLIHPEWLTIIPEGHKWTILHHVVRSGNLSHLNEVLALSAANKEFRLLCKTADNKTVQDIAAEQEYMYPYMTKRITRLVMLDQILNMAKACQWRSLRELICQHPNLINEKPPYRRYYVAHHLANRGQLDLFKDLHHICPFNLKLLGKHKTISQIAREHGHSQFAEYVEGLDSSPIAPKSASKKQSDTHGSILISGMPKETIRQLITCCITQDILGDPVMAADGFTYEREAIVKWLQQSNRSPMTNQELDNLELKPNYAIKSIIQLYKDTTSAKK